MGISKRNTTLDAFKLLAAYMVVFIHNNLCGNVGVAVDAIARFAVPLFFVSSGFFCYNNDADKIKKKMIHIVKLFLFATLFYHCMNILLFVAQGQFEQIKDYFIGCFEIRTMLKFLLLNKPESSTHLWFLLALIYSYAIQLLVVKVKVPNKLVYMLSGCALVLHLILGEGLLVFGIALPIGLVRNFLLFGYPFFVFGMLMRRYSEKMVLIKGAVLSILLIVGIVESVMSSLFFGKNEMYVGTVLTVFSIVVFALKYPSIRCLQKLEPLCMCGTYIYIFHQMVGKSINIACKLAGVDTTTTLYLDIKPFAVCIISTVFAYILVKAENKIKAKKLKKA
ncbi:MAG: acyltransferase [Ruminococcus sp.]|nr:acyltransferase [Ruminococcus sp.]